MRIQRLTGARPREFFALASPGAAGSRSVHAVASTCNPDRYGEVVVPAGLKPYLKVFQANPVMLPSHQMRLENGKPAVIGACNNVRIGPDAIEFDAEFLPAELSELGDAYGKLYLPDPPKMRAFSIGFLPIEGMYPENEDDIKECCASLSDGALAKIIKAYRSGKGVNKPRFFYTAWELLEISPVAVPANRESLLAASAAGLGLATGLANGLGADTDGAGRDHPDVRDLPDAAVQLRALARELPEPVQKWIAARAAAPAAAPAVTLAVQPGGTPAGAVDILGADGTTLRIKADAGGLTVGPVPAAADDAAVAEAIASRAVVPHKTYPKVTEAKWAWSKAEQDGVLGEDDWARYKAAHTWWDREADPDNAGVPAQKGAYKLPHHVVRDGVFVTHWPGVAVAMAALLGARGGTKIPDGERRGVYNHLAAHYREFEKEPPEFKAWEPEALRAYFAAQGIDLAAMPVDEDATETAAATTAGAAPVGQPAPMTLERTAEPQPVVVHVHLSLGGAELAEARTLVDRLERATAAARALAAPPPAPTGEGAGAPPVVAPTKASPPVTGGVAPPVGGGAGAAPAAPVDEHLLAARLAVIAQKAQTAARRGATR